MQRRDAGMYIIRPRASRHGDETPHGPDGSISSLRAHYMTGDFERRLVSSGMALIVSRVSIEDQADSVTQMHFHQLEQVPANASRSTKLEILGAHNRSIVIPFADDIVKDRALAHIRQARFNFIDEQNVKLDVRQLSEATANKTDFVLGSVPLTSLGRLNDALRPFFANSGHVLNIDVMDCPFRGGRVTTKVIVRDAFCPVWLQKTTVTRDGPRDQQIQVERAATCFYCHQVNKADPTRPGAPQGPSQQPRRNETSRNNGKGAEKAPNNQVQKRSIAGFQTPRHSEMVPGIGNAPQQNRYQDCTVSALRAPFRSDNDPRDGNVPQRAANTQNQTHSTDAPQSPARASNSRTTINAPNRKVIFPHLINL